MAASGRRAEAVGTLVFLCATAALIRRARRRAASTRVIEPPAPPFLPADALVTVLSHLPFGARVTCAAVSHEWFQAVQRPELWAVVDMSVLGRRDLPKAALQSLVQNFLSAATVSVDLGGVRNADDELIAALIARTPNCEMLKLCAGDAGDATLAAAAACCPKLRRLLLWAARGVTDTGVSAIGCLDSCARLSLRELDLRFCVDVDHDDTLAALARGCPHLQTLRLKGVGASMSDRVLAAIGESCHALTTLDVSGGACTDAGLRALAAGCPRIAELYLSGCRRVSCVGVIAISAGCAASLRLLDLQGCSAVGDPAAMALAANCAAALETISFQCCPLLSDKGFGALVDACPRLRHITLKHCDVSDESIARAEAFNEQLQVRRVDSGKPLEVGSVGSYDY